MNNAIEFALTGIVIILLFALLVSGVTGAGYVEAVVGIIAAMLDIAEAILQG